MKLERILAAFLFAVAGLATGDAGAVLGEPVTVATPAAGTAASGTKTAARMRALGAGVQVVESALAGGTVREYVAPSGVVFAIAWSTRLKPRLTPLLGRYHVAYATAATREAASGPLGRRAVVLREGDLVVQSGGRMQAFTGRAWVPSLTPAGFDAAAVR